MKPYSYRDIAAESGSSGRGWDWFRGCILPAIVLVAIMLLATCAIGGLALIVEISKL